MGRKSKRRYRHLVPPTMPKPDPLAIRVPNLVERVTRTQESIHANFQRLLAHVAQTRRQDE